MAKDNARRHTSPCEAGTMWVMKRNGRTARCALLLLPRECELRVLLDGELLLAKRCLEESRVLDVAEDWKRRLAARGWCSVNAPLAIGA